MKRPDNVEQAAREHNSLCHAETYERSQHFAAREQPRARSAEGDADGMQPITKPADPPFPRDERTILEECFEYALEAKRDLLLGYSTGAFEAGLALCESPIERRLYAALFGALLGYFSERRAITPQANVGPYRIDFLVTIGARGRGDIRIAVECDGHDFHEKTKDQARRDKARDRYMQSAGILVARFAGSEIWADPLTCAQQVLVLAYGARTRLESVQQ